jgi:hypothetical protein
MIFVYVYDETVPMSCDPLKLRVRTRDAVALAALVGALVYLALHPVSLPCVGCDTGGTFYRCMEGTGAGSRTCELYRDMSSAAVKLKTTEYAKELSLLSTNLPRYLSDMAAAVRAKTLLVLAAVRERLSGVWAHVSASLKSLLQKAELMAGATWDAVYDAVIRPLVQGVVKYIIEPVTSLIDNVVAFVKRVLGEIERVLGSAGEALGDAYDAAYGASAKMSETVEGVLSGAAVMIEKLVDGIRNGTNAALSGVVGGVEDAVNAVGRVANSAVDGVEGAINATLRGTVDGANGAVNGVIDELNKASNTTERLVNESLATIVKGVQGGLDGAAGGIETSVNALGSGIVGMAGAVIDETESIVNDMSDGLEKSVNAVVGGLNTGVIDPVESAVNGAADIIEQTVAKLLVPIQDVAGGINKIANVKIPLGAIGDLYPLAFLPVITAPAPVSIPRIDIPSIGEVDIPHASLPELKYRLPALGAPGPPPSAALLATIAAARKNWRARRSGRRHGGAPVPAPAPAPAAPAAPAAPVSYGFMPNNEVSAPLGWGITMPSTASLTSTINKIQDSFVEVVTAPPKTGAAAPAAPAPAWKLGDKCPAGTTDVAGICFYDRGVGKIPDLQCPTGQVQRGVECWDAPPDGYDWTTPGGLLYGKVCPKGSNDSGTTCWYDRGVGKIPDDYGRGAGYVVWNEDKCKRESGVDCEKYGALWYPKCKAGYHNVGCCVCAADGCGDDQEKIAGLCYPKPRAGFTCRATNCSFSKDVTGGKRRGVTTQACTDASREMSEAMCYTKPKDGFVCAMTTCNNIPAALKGWLEANKQQALDREAEMKAAAATAATKVTVAKATMAANAARHATALATAKAANAAADAARRAGAKPDRTGAITYVDGVKITVPRLEVPTVDVPTIDAHVAFEAPRVSLDVPKLAVTLPVPQVKFDLDGLDEGVPHIPNLLDGVEAAMASLSRVLADFFDPVWAAIGSLLAYANSVAAAVVHFIRTEITWANVRAGFANLLALGAEGVRELAEWMRIEIGAPLLKLVDFLKGSIIDFGRYFVGLATDLLGSLRVKLREAWAKTWDTVRPFVRESALIAGGVGMFSVGKLVDFAIPIKSLSITAKVYVALAVLVLALLGAQLRFFKDFVVKAARICLTPLMFADQAFEAAVASRAPGGFFARVLGFDASAFRPDC